jgi:hypothetical protein
MRPSARINQRCALLAFALAPLLAACHLPLQPFTSSCKANEEISPKDREVVDEVALKFVQDALGPDPSLAYITFTAEVKSSLSREQFIAGLRDVINPIGAFKDRRVVATYLAKVTGSNQAQRVVCGNLSSPEKWVAVSVKPGPAEAHVIVEAHTTNNTMNFVLWLIPEQDIWRVQYIHFATVQMVGKSAGDLRRIAEAATRKQHYFNAFVLYAGALFDP